MAVEVTGAIRELVGEIARGWLKRSRERLGTETPKGNRKQRRLRRIEDRGSVGPGAELGPGSCQALRVKGPDTKAKELKP